METLTEEQRKKNHIRSENRRRDNIREKFDILVNLVPSLDPKENRSEHVILMKTAKYIEELREKKQQQDLLKK